jgi:hypothetical protein
MSDTDLQALFDRWQRKREEIEALPADYSDQVLDLLGDQLDDIEVAIGSHRVISIEDLKLVARVARYRGLRMHGAGCMVSANDPLLSCLLDGIDALAVADVDKPATGQ